MPDSPLAKIVGLQTSFLHKRESGRIQFTTEPCNLTNQNSFKYSGLANSKAIGINTATKIEKNAVKADNGVVITTKQLKSKKAGGSVLSKPAQTFKSTKSTKPSVQLNFRRVANQINKTVGRYRPDLVQTALARWTKIHRSIVSIKVKVHRNPPFPSLVSLHVT